MLALLKDLWQLPSCISLRAKYHHIRLVKHPVTQLGPIENRSSEVVAYRKLKTIKNCKPKLTVLKVVVVAYDRW